MSTYELGQGLTTPAESNAVAYINAVYDAWTEKLPGPFVVLSALVGRVPRYGLYTLSGRAPTTSLGLRGIKQLMIH
ncbi:aconitase X [Vulcanisaeta sp. JCM 14467]|uniref:aconitase X n=1 Tax=Vulcanisaeta sp. JCM 14467 TaxID=1295370 RepID=UPI0020920557|nr:aconitase X [Vulcanisaeta sp. JCM 14467]